ncbi:MAG: TraB/GumN family protein [Clostridia bacterium]|nr:TraB/GumN family protein [Clostridia bacterium]
MTMIKRLAAVFIAVLLVFTASSCGDNASDQKKAYDCPLLWHVTDKDGGEMWLFGTIHIGNKSSKEVLERLQPVLEKCDALAVEFDAVSYAKDISAQTKDLSLFVYNDGTTISDHIPKQLYDNLVDTLKEEKLYNKLYENFKPGFWSLLLNQAMISKSKLSAEKAMDTLLIKDANSANREILEVESAAFQYEIFANAPDDYTLLSLEKDLESIDDAEEELNKLYNAWLIGDAQKIIESDEYYDFTEEEQRIVDDFNDELLRSRNLNMAKKAKEYLESGKTVFFAVGTMHFLGEDGIVSLLEKEGCSIERVGF